MPQNHTQKYILNALEYSHLPVSEKALDKEVWPDLNLMRYIVLIVNNWFGGTQNNKSSNLF